MSVSLLEITASLRSGATTASNNSRGSERVSLSAEASSVVGKLPQKPLNLITIWGAARTGKSFVMNALARTENDVFAVAGGCNPCTVGAFISTTTRSLSEFGSESGGPTSLSSSFSAMNVGSGVEPAIGFVDVEGQGDKHNTYETKLATPLLLLSKVVIFNWHGLPNKATMLDRLGKMREAAARVHRSQRKGAFGHLIVLLRDIPNEKVEIEAQTLLFNPEEDFWGPNISDEAFNQMKLRNDIRMDLKASFQSLRVCCLPAPHAEINGDRQISQGEVSPAFAAKVKNLRLELVKGVLAEPHCIGNEAIVGGEVLSSLLTGVCDAVNSELKDFFPLSLMESVQQGRAETVLSESKNVFSQSVANRVEDAPPVSKAATKKVLEAATSTAVEYFTRQSVAKSVASKYRKMLDEAITEGSNACYARQERQVSDANNDVNRLRSECLLRVDAKAKEIFVNLPMEAGQLELSWKRLCVEAHGELQGDIEKHVGNGILEDLQETLPTLQQFEQSVIGKFNNLTVSNQTLLTCEQNNGSMKQELQQQREDNACIQQQLKQQGEAMREQERVLRQMQVVRDDEERAKQAERAAAERMERWTMMKEVGTLLVTLAGTVYKATRPGKATAKRG